MSDLLDFVGGMHKRLLRMKGAAQQYQERYAQAEASLAELSAYEEAVEKARVIMQEAAERVQSKLEVSISGLVSMALASVFPDPYEFKVRFHKHRNKTEALLLFVNPHTGDEMSPMDCAGGGAVDVASFALRLAFWALGSSANTIVLDEPFKYVSVAGGLQDKCSVMVKHLSEKLGLQIIMISHLPDMISAADNVITVRQIRKGQAVVEGGEVRQEEAADTEQLPLIEL